MSDTGSRAALATLVSLHGMGPARLRAVLAGRTPAEALSALRAGRPPEPPPPDTPPPPISRRLLARWRDEARSHRPDELLEAYARAGFGVVMYGEPGYPTRLLADPEPPLLAVDGDLARTAPQTVAIIGTRRCTRAGADTARQLGQHLSMAGVTVVSGLAAGIDAAAHDGALAARGAPPLAVAGTGLDVPYPPKNTTLWRKVAATGAIVSEAPLGANPDRWRFPARNRIIAGLSELVVVVESPERGGSMHTVDEADARSIDVLAVPGPVQAPHSAGTNALLHEGRGIARGASDVLAALGLTSTVPDPRSAQRSDAPTVPPTTPPPGVVEVLDAFEWQAATTDQLVMRTGRDLFEVCAILDDLVRSGAVATQSGWFERTTRS